MFMNVASYLMKPIAGGNCNKRPTSFKRLRYPREPIAGGNNRNTVALITSGECHKTRLIYSRRGNLARSVSLIAFATQLLLLHFRFCVLHWHRRERARERDCSIKPNILHQIPWAVSFSSFRTQLATVFLLSLCLLSLPPSVQATLPPQ